MKKVVVEERAKADRSGVDSKPKEDLKLMEITGVDDDIDIRVRAREAALRAKEEERKAEKEKVAIDLAKRAQAREDAVRAKTDEAKGAKEPEKQSEIKVQIDAKKEGVVPCTPKFAQNVNIDPTLRH